MSASTPRPGSQLAFDAPLYRVVHECEGFVIGVHENVSIVVWGAPATVLMVQQLEALARAAERDQAEGGSTIHVLVDGVAPPSGQARSRLVELTDRSAQRLACSVTVLEGEGFWASGMRGMVMGLHSVRNRRFRSHFCATLEDAARWLPAPHARMTGTELDEAKLREALRSLRERVQGG